MKEAEHKYLKNIINELPETCETPADYLYMANIYVATQERLYFKLKQIEKCDYNWLSQSIVSDCLKRFEEIIGIECKTRIPVFEQSLIDYSMHDEHENIDTVLKPFFQDENINFRFSARLDLVTEISVWELKCTTRITIDHLLQTVIYAWLWRIIIDDNENPRTIRILNIKSGEQYRLCATTEELTQIVVALLKSKYTEQALKNDEEFIEECNSIM
jgi:hemerythrin